MNYEKSILIYHLVIMIFMIVLGYMFLAYYPNPLNISSPFNYVLGGALIFYGSFRGMRAWKHYKVK